MSVSALPMVTDADVRSAITVADALEVVEQTYADFGQGRLALSRPAITRVGDGLHGFGLKGALLERYGVAGVRVTPTHTGGHGSWCLVLETASGRPLVAVEETWLHRLRTAASAAVAARLLARPDSRVLTLVGAGRIARFVPAAFAAAFELDEVRVVARTAAKAAEFAAGQSLPGVTVTAGTDLDAAAPGSDIVVAITSARQPVVQPHHLLPGGTLIGLGGGAEIAPDVLTAAADRFFVDDLGYAREIGSVASWLSGGLPPDTLTAHLTGTLSAVATGTLAGRASATDRILAVVQGVAACDVALACLVMRRLGIA